MIRHLGIMLFLGILLALVSQVINAPTQYSSGAEYIGYIIGYIFSFSVILILISLSITLIPYIIYRLTKKKHIPDFKILTWSIWIILVILILTSQIYKNFTKVEAKKPMENKIFNTMASKVYKTVENSVHLIYTEDKNNQPKFQGSAIAVTNKFLATNCHIINSSDHFNIIVNNKKELGKLYSEHGDLCIVSVPNSTFNPVNMRFSKNVSIGEEVFAVGNPEGLEKTISRGIISNKFDKDGITFLQTDAAISHGSSGGGLFDRNGKLIGITTSKLFDAEGIGFVISTEIITAALLEPRITLKKLEDNQQNSIIEEKTSTIPENNTENKELTHIGYYGDNEIGLIKNNEKCFITIPGRYRSL